jgi:hypothetical protein
MLFNYLGRVIAHRLDSPYGLGVLGDPHNHFLRLFHSVSGGFRAHDVLVEIYKCHDGALIFGGHQHRSGFL